MKAGIGNLWDQTELTHDWAEPSVPKYEDQGSDTQNPHKPSSNSSIQKTESGDPSGSWLARSSAWAQLRDPASMNKVESNQGNSRL